VDSISVHMVYEVVHVLNYVTDPWNPHSAVSMLS